MQDNQFTNDMNIYSMILRIKSTKGQLGGYDPRFFISAIPDRCLICDGVPSLPFKVSCKHRVCYSCLGYLFGENQNAFCTFHNIELMQKDNVKDTILTGQVAIAKIRCPFSIICNWNGQLNEVEFHFQQCTGVTNIFKSWMTSIQYCITKISKKSITIQKDFKNLNMEFQQYKEDSEHRYNEQLRTRNSIMSKLDDICSQHNININIKESNLNPPPVSIQQYDLAYARDRSYEITNPPFPREQNTINDMNQHQRNSNLNAEIPGLSFWNCEFCQGKNISIDIVCEQCGKTRISHYKSEPMLREEHNSILCKCGFENTRDHVVCGNCNQSLTEYANRF